MADTLNITLTLNNGQFSAALNQSGQQIAQFSSSLRGANNAVNTTGNSMTNFATKVRHSVMTLGLARHAVLNLWTAFGKLPASIIETNAGFERMMVLLTNMAAGDTIAEKTAAANLEFEKLIDLSKQAPFSIAAIQDAWVKMKSAGIDPANGSLKSLLDAVASFGGTEDVLHRAAIAIQQMAGKGVISMEELRQQLGEAVPTAMQNLADSMGISVQRLAKEIAKGGVESKRTLQYLFVEFDRLYGNAGQKMMETFSGRVSVLKTEWALFANTVGQSSGLFDTAKGSISIITNLLKDPEFTRSMSDIASGIAGMIKNAMELIRWMFEWRKQIGMLIVALGGWLTITRYIVPAVMTFGGALVTAGIAVRSFTTYIQILWLIFRQNGLREAITQTGYLLKSLFAISPAGWVGLIAAASAAVIMWMVKTSKAADDAADHIKRYWEIADRKEIEKSVQSLKNYNEQLAEIRKILQSGTYTDSEDGKPVERNLDDFPRMRASLEKQAQELQKKIEEEASYVGRASRAATKRETEESTRQYLEGLDAQTDAIKLGYNTQIEKTKAAINEAYKDLTDGEKQASAAFRAAKLAFLEASKDETLKVLKDQEAQLEAQLIKAGERERDGIYANLQGVRARIENIISASKVASEGLIKSLDNTGKVNEEAQSLWNQLEVQLAKAREFVTNRTDAAEEEVGAVTRLNQIIREAAKDGGIAVSPDLIAKIKAGSAELADLKNKSVGIREEIDRQKDAFKGLADRIGSATAELDLWIQDSSDGTLSKISTEFEKAFKWVEKTKKGITDQAKLEEFISKSKELLTNSSTLDYHEKLFSLQQEEKNNLEDLAMTEQERNRIQRERFDAELKSFTEKAYLSETEKANIQAITDRINGQRDTLEKLKTPLGQLAQAWADTTAQMQQATANWVSSGVDMLVQFAETGKMQFGKFAKAILSDILKIIMRAMIAQAILSALGISPGVSTGSSWKDMLGNIFGANIPVTPKAKGGIVDSQGDMPLRRYAQGGIAKRPQMALFGEGSLPEAYVPLPDGRSIPVTVNSRGGQQAPNVSVNVINQSGQQVTAEQKGGPKFDGNGFVLDVVLKAVNQPGPFRDSMRSAVR